MAYFTYTLLATVRIIMRKIEIERSCEPYMYNTYDDLNKIEIGNILTLKFGKSIFSVKTEYVGKEVKFIVNNFFEHNWQRLTRRLALIPIDKVENFKDSDVLFLDDAYRFECLMIDLFPCNQIPYDGWENKTVKIVAVE
jgi:hypothetical protein